MSDCHNCCQKCAELSKKAREEKERLEREANKK